MTKGNSGINSILLAAAGWTAALVWTVGVADVSYPAVHAAAAAPALTRSAGAGDSQTPVSPVKAAMESTDEAAAASAGCVTCHTKTDEASMHPSGTVTLGGNCLGVSCQTLPISTSGGGFSSRS